MKKNNEQILKKEIAISILGLRDFKKEYIEKYIANVSKLRKEADKKNMLDLAIHYDVLDNKFANNTGVDLEDIKIAKKNNITADVHLMVKYPIEDGYIDTAIKNGANYITIHYEIENFEKVLNYLYEKKNKEKKEFKIGVSLKPDTDILILEKYIHMIDKILIMTVEPGYGAQEYITEMNEKIKIARQMFKNKLIQIDGGINENTIRKSLQYVNSFVLGSYFTNKINQKDMYIDMYNRYILLNIINDINMLPKDINYEFTKNVLQIKENGYGKKDELIGTSVVNIRKLVNKYGKNFSKLNFVILKQLLSFDIHEYRIFALLIYIFYVKNIKREYRKNKISSKDYLNKLENINEEYFKNKERINNWNLVDISAPHILGEYLMYLYKIGEKNKFEKILNKYNESTNFWVNRIAIVSMLTLIKNNLLDVAILQFDKYMYSDNKLLQKATGWMLREIYKKDNTLLVEYLYKRNSNKEIPKIILSYATEKMKKEEVLKIKGRII